MIKIENLNKYFLTPDNSKNSIYKDLNLEIQEGDIISILGKSGTGKTTLLNMFSGLEDFQSGKLTINNTPIENLTNNEKTHFRAQNISFIFQNFNLIDNLTVSENIDLIVELNKGERRFSTIEILKKVGLEDKKDSYPFNLSGGEQQRIAVARAFIAKTPILLADEPTGNLDKNNSDNIIKIILDLHRESKNTIILITHDLEIAQIADKIYSVENYSLKKQ
ncbi:ABC transporter ATP-binding protein [Candidatus Gracilibacteria bacterium 28_42_T64]|nr:ABC transporter ATP-binding protein [Candidatus Gracilibacteria bacterium 28_42_T64]